MTSSQHNRMEDATSHSPCITCNRRYPSHVYTSNSSTPLTSQYRDMNPGVYLADNHLQSLDFTDLPSLRHEGCGQMNTHETITQSHGLPCQGCISNFACDPFPHLKPSSNSAWTKSDWTNPSDLLSGSLPSYCHTDQIDRSTIELQSTQMQSNGQFPFVPTGGQDTMSADSIYTSTINQRTHPSRLSSTPRLSHATTPDSVFSTPQQSQAFGYGLRGIAGLDSIIIGEETAQHMDTNMSASPLDSETKVDTYSPRDRDTTSNDWLSEHTYKQEWTDNQGIQQFQHDQHAVHPGDHNSFPSSTSPQQFLTNISSSFSPNKVFDQHNGSLHYHSSSGSFPLDFSANVYTMPPASRTLNGYPTNNGSFMMVGGQDVYNVQPNLYLGDFDFNHSPLYPAPSTLYNFPTPQNALPTQNISAPSASNQSNRVRSTNRAADLDDKLVKWRAYGMTYREIMKKGNWGLEESTLRGRYRTLTKNKEERVRKPVWNLPALSALVAGVDRFAPSTTSNNPRSAEGIDKVPWKKVADWMHREKDCYLYGNATVKKKYKELVGDQLLQHDVNQWRRANGELPF